MFLSKTAFIQLLSFLLMCRTLVELARVRFWEVTLNPVFLDNEDLQGLLKCETNEFWSIVR